MCVFSFLSNWAVRVRVRVRVKLRVKLRVRFRVRARARARARARVRVRANANPNPNASPNPNPNLDVHDGVEDRLQVRLDRLRVGALREHLEQRRVGHEEEAREGGALLVEVAGECLLAELELLEHVGQQLLEAVVAVDVQQGDGLLVGLGHDLDPVLVDGLEALALLRQLLGDVARGEDGLEVLPHGLHLD